MSGGGGGPADVRVREFQAEGTAVQEEATGGCCSWSSRKAERRGQGPVLQGLWNQHLSLEPDSSQVEFSPGHRPAS